MKLWRVRETSSYNTYDEFTEGIVIAGSAASAIDLVRRKHTECSCPNLAANSELVAEEILVEGPRRILLEDTSPG